jgi:hypothetical protein
VYGVNPLSVPRRYRLRPRRGSYDLWGYRRQGLGFPR